MTKTTVAQFLHAKTVGVPLINIITPDAEVTIKKLQSALSNSEKSDPNIPIVQWDCVRGWVGRNTAGSKAIQKMYLDLEIEQNHTINPVKMMVYAEKLPKHTVLFVLSAHHRTHQMETATFWQALWNLRDQYKGDFRTVVLLSPSISLPLDVSSDVLTIEEPFPDETELKEIVEDVVSLVPGASYSQKMKDQAAKALLGLSPFSAEQATALALTKSSINIDEINERKREILNDIPGLKIHKSSETFADIGGCDEIKAKLTRILKGKESPEVIVFIDEGEKAFAGATHSLGDNTGVSQDFMGTLLTYMDSNECDGAIFVGPSGTAKSALAKAAGNESKVPTVFLDLGGMKTSLLGASEHRLRYALQTIHALGKGRVFFIMTSNNVGQMPPEFKRRFSSGTFFFDLPSSEEQSKIWDIHLKKYGLPKEQVKEFEHPEWTGAEIRNCCRIAYRENITLKEASAYIVPVAQSGAEAIRELRRAAHEKFLSANYSGTYQIPELRDQV